MMIIKADPSIADRAKRLYDEKLKSVLEKSELDKFVAIEPDSGDFFIGGTLSESIRKARQKYPKRLAHVMRVGHQAAVHFGMHIQ
jgi:hypothetical protein